MRWLWILAFSSPALAVVDGQRVTANSPSEPWERQAFSAIVHLGLGQRASGSCTGTVISRTPPLVVSAKHCFAATRVIGALTFLDADLHELPTLIPPKVKRVQPGPGDYAVIELEDGFLPAATGVAALPNLCPMLSPGQKLWIAGYGVNAFELEKKDGRSVAKEAMFGGGFLRWGTNEFSGYRPGHFTFASPKAFGITPDSGAGVNVGSGMGDSGGPVFAKPAGESKLVLAGINVSVQLASSGNKIEHNAVDVCDPAVRDFLKKPF